jgi:hypothetical protein
LQIEGRLSVYSRATLKNWRTNANMRRSNSKCLVAWVRGVRETGLPLPEAVSTFLDRGIPMDAVAITVGLGWTIAGLLSLGLAIPLVRGQIGRNALYGVRFPESFRSDEAWFAINRYGGQRMMIWSIPIIATGILCFFLPLQARPGLALVLAFTPLLFVLFPVWDSWRFARRFSAKPLDK